LLETINPSTFLVASEKSDLRPALFQFAVHNQLVLLTMKEQQRSLEDVFQDLTR
jgi:ABC-2 type transport system ATP-binding protein